MKALRFYAPKDVRLEDVPEPECGPDEVKIRVRNCSTCGTDVKIFNNGHQNISPPRTMGHEVAGEVVEVGADVTGWSPGDRVQVIAAGSPRGGYAGPQGGEGGCGEPTPRGEPHARGVA